MFEPVGRGQHGDPMTNRRQFPGAELSLQSCADQGLVHGRGQFPPQVAFRGSARDVIHHELQDRGLRRREAELDAESGDMPARPVTQRAGVAACGVGGSCLGQKLAHRIRGLLRELLGQHESGCG